jgi:hypothetical protein
MTDPMQNKKAPAGPGLFIAQFDCDLLHTIFVDR